MSINPAVHSFIGELRGKVFFCHQATYSIFAHTMTGIREVKNEAQANHFASVLKNIREDGIPNITLRSIPPHLYDVFGYFIDDKIYHSSIIVDVDPVIKVAELDNLQGAIRIHLADKDIDFYSQFESMLFRNELLYGIFKDLMLRG